MLLHFTPGGGGGLASMKYKLRSSGNTVGAAFNDQGVPLSMSNPATSTTPLPMIRRPRGTARRGGSGVDPHQLHILKGTMF